MKRLFALLALLLLVASLPVRANDPACGSDCVQKVCRPVSEMKKTTRVVYECKEEDYCLKKCPRHSLLGLFGHRDCSSCPDCEKPRTRKILIKKIIPEETPTFRCVVEKVPVGQPCATSGAAPAPR